MLFQHVVVLQRLKRLPPRHCQPQLLQLLSQLQVLLLEGGLLGTPLFTLRFLIGSALLLEQFLDHPGDVMHQLRVMHARPS